MQTTEKGYLWFNSIPGSLIKLKNAEYQEEIQIRWYHHGSNNWSGL